MTLLIVCRPGQKSGRLNACPTQLRQLWIQVGGSGGFSCDFDPGRLLSRALEAA
jgi:hypothetical protein